MNSLYSRGVVSVFGLGFIELLLDSLVGGVSCLLKLEVLELLSGLIVGHVLEVLVLRGLELLIRLEVFGLGLGRRLQLSRIVGFLRGSFGLLDLLCRFLRLALVGLQLSRREASSLEILQQLVESGCRIVSRRFLALLVLFTRFRDGGGFSLGLLALGGRFFRGCRFPFRLGWLSLWELPSLAPFGVGCTISWYF